MNINTSFENGTTDIRGVGQQAQGSSKSRAVNGPNGVFQLSKKYARTGNSSVRVNLTNTDERGEYVFNTGKNKSYTLKWSMLLPKDLGKAGSGQNQYTILNQFGNRAGWTLARQGRLIVDSHKIEVRNNKTGRTSIKRIDQVNENVETIVRARGASNNLVLPNLNSNSLRYTFNQYRGTDNKGRHRFSAEDFNVPIRRGEWNDFEINVRPTSNNTGFYQFKVNDKTVVNRSNIALVASELSGLQIKIGPYIGNHGNGTREVFIDDVQFGESAGGVFKNPAPQSKNPAPLKQEKPVIQPSNPAPLQQENPIIQPSEPEPLTQKDPVPQILKGKSVLGTNRKDILIGTDGNDKIIAGNGNDTIRAGGGNDQIQTGLGKDTVFLGQGENKLIYKNPNEGLDIIHQFDDDKIYIDQKGFGMRNGGPIGGRFTLGSRATKAFHRFIYNPQSGVLQFDPDGTRQQSAMIIATFEGEPTLTRNDIQLV